MLGISSHLISTQTANIPEKKKVRFNEENINQTLHPVNKDYGLMAICQLKTPFPKRYTVPPDVIRKRLEECIKKANRLLNNESSDAEENESTTETSDRQITMCSLPSKHECCKHYEFVKKRKEFNQAEFIIAQQKSMSFELPEPGPSIGDKWRIVDCDVNSFMRSMHDISPKVSNWQSDVNYEAMHEIVRQTLI